MRTAAFATALLLTAAGCTTDPPGEVVSASESAQFLRGRNLFFNETFAGNGRTCETCHTRNEVGDNFDITPAAIAALPPSDPIFRSIDSDDGVGTSYTLLRRDATMRIPFTLPANITVDEPNGPNVHHNANGTTTVIVRRSTPTIENIALEDALMWDGRFGDDLPFQAGEAVKTHNQPGRVPTAQEKADLAAYQETFFTSLGVRLYANGGPPPVLPQGRNASEQRGRTFFVDTGPIDATHRGLCSTCHGGPMLNTTTASNPVQIGGQRITNNFVSETNSFLGNNNPELTYRITLLYTLFMPAGLPFPIPPGTPLIPAGTVLTLRSSDPGRILTTGDPCEFPAACIINFGSTTSLFKIPTLWGVADSAPYFHDNSAANFDELMNVYQFLFQVTADGLGNPAFVISAQDRADIIAYMSFAFRRHPNLN